MVRKVALSLADEIRGKENVKVDVRVPLAVEKDFPACQAFSRAASSYMSRYAPEKRMTVQVRHVCTVSDERPSKSWANRLQSVVPSPTHAGMPTASVESCRNGLYLAHIHMAAAVPRMGRCSD